MLNRLLSIRDTAFIPAVVFALVLLAPSPSRAQFSWDQPRKNLEVLPDTISAEELRSTMLGFANALGVRCWFCHDDSQGRDIDQIDFASEAKPEKEIARLMMRMTETINTEYVAKVSHGEEADEPQIPVTCITCHRGTEHPRRIEDVLAETIARDGLDAARSKYFELRERYYGGMAYDFSSASLNSLGYRLLGEGKVDEAISIFKLNVEMHPEASNPYDSLAEAYLARGDTLKSVVLYQKSLALNPDNDHAAEQLTKIK